MPSYSSGVGYGRLGPYLTFTVTGDSAMEKMNIPWLILSLQIFIFFSLNRQLAFGADTISANQSLSGTQTTVSSGGHFVLGFFKPGNSSNYYIGNLVWVANREITVHDIHSSELKISNGNLVLFNESQVPIWSTNISSSSSYSVVAVLEDGGNLVLKDGTKSSTPLWQSLDHPTHTWLPGGKLSLNRRTNQSRLLTSWKNSEDPAPGLFSLELDPNGTNQSFILWNRSEQYWTSGAWDPQRRIFSLVPEMRLNEIYNYSYVSNENESYFTYSLYDPSTISRFVMDVSGQIKKLSWLESSQRWSLIWSEPRQQCEVYAFCGAFGSCNEKALPFCNCLTGFEPKSESDWNLSDFSKGCKRKTQLQCEDPTLAHGKSDKFLEMPNIKLPQHEQSMTVGSISECESTCLKNCSCNAYAYDSWLAASEFSSSSNKSGIIIGAVAGTVGVVLCLVVFAMLRWRRGTMRNPKAVEGSLLASGYRDLQIATKNFSEKLGGGGFGSVFKGMLADSSVIAVKQLERINQGEKQFCTEVSTIGTIQHVNLVRLRGFCSDGARKLLVYDYMPKGSLDAHLVHESNSDALDWKTRYQIALGTARGLVYLHEKCRDCIIHCDIKPENILLDAEFCPKVADFGLAKLVGRDFSRVLTTMRGTRGYLAPEWISGVAITPKADVYSYGMMLFEIVSGRRNSQQSEDGKVRFIPTWAASLITEGGDVLSLLDPRLNGVAPVEEISRLSSSDARGGFGFAPAAGSKISPGVSRRAGARIALIRVILSREFSESELHLNSLSR
ncbi:hypothetical protein Golob_008139 [Gossypium lobatum]|uniref:Receptor-like serine/threonine-protein kinase n=2 Tax=Gossypium lobatum TaxID=34289 RepID=A0A7J8MEL0_9ROSI|nr:hypothetical protein [Gossypium lobatum]